MRKANTNSIIIHFQSFPISAVAQVSCGPSHSLEHKILHFFLRWLSIGHRCLRGRCPFHHHIPTFRWALTIKRFCDYLRLAHDFIVFLLIVLQLTRTNASPEVTEFRITHLGHVHVSINGLGPLGWILSGLSTFIVNIIKPTIANAINQPLKQAIANELSKVHFPL